MIDNGIDPGPTRSQPRIFNRHNIGKNMKRIITATLITVMALMSASCSSKVDLNGDWKITSVGTEMVESSEAPPTLSFNSETGRVHGYTGVNIVNGDYTHDGRKLSINGLGATMMAGPEEDMIIERKILDVFGTPVKTRLTEEGSLEFLTPDDEVVMTLERK